MKKQVVRCIDCRKPIKDGSPRVVRSNGQYLVSLHLRCDKKKLHS